MGAIAKERLLFQLKLRNRSTEENYETPQSTWLVSGQRFEPIITGKQRSSNHPTMTDKCICLFNVTVPIENTYLGWNEARGSLCMVK